MEKIAELSSLDIFDAFLNSLEELHELYDQKRSFNNYERRAPITRSSTNLRRYEDMTIFNPSLGPGHEVMKESDLA